MWSNAFLNPGSKNTLWSSGSEPNLWTSYHSSDISPVGVQSVHLLLFQSNFCFNGAACLWLFHNKPPACNRINSWFNFSEWKRKKVPVASRQRLLPVSVGNELCPNSSSALCRYLTGWWDFLLRDMLWQHRRRSAEKIWKKTHYGRKIICALIRVYGSAALRCIYGHIVIIARSWCPRTHHFTRASINALLIYALLLKWLGDI